MELDLELEPELLEAQPEDLELEDEDGFLENPSFSFTRVEKDGRPLLLLEELRELLLLLLDELRELLLLLDLVVEYEIIESKTRSVFANDKFVLLS